MSKTYKIKVNQGADSAKFVDIPQVGASGKAVAVKAVPGGKYQLLDASTGYAPENIRATRSGKNLQVFFEGRAQPDLVIEDYYEVTPEGFNGLIGESESGRFYEYIPESAVGNTAVPLLADGSTQVGMALGGAEISASGAAVGALVAAAAFNPLLLAPLALLGAGGGGGGGGGQVPNNNSAAIRITKVTLDTGVSDSDFVTKGPVTEFSGTLSNFTGTPGDKVKLQLLDKGGNPVLEGTVTPDLNGVWTWKWPPVNKDDTTNLPEVLKDGNYTLKATIVTSAGVAFTHATASATQALTIDNLADGPNKDALVSISSITDDTGINNADFITNDQTLVFKGGYDKFTPNGDLIKLELKDKDGITVDFHYFEVKGQVPNSTNTPQKGEWTWDRSSKTLPTGQYTLVASIVDPADNEFTSVKKDNIIIDRLGPEGDKGVAIVSMDLDSGVGEYINASGQKVDSSKDFITNDNTPKFTGTVTVPLLGDEWIQVQVVQGNNVIETGFVKAPDRTWTWEPNKPLADGNYSLNAQVVDVAGNPAVTPGGEIIPAASQAVVIDTRGPVDPTDPNAGFVVGDIKILGDGDTGQSKTDFITKAGGSMSDLISFGGTLTGGKGKYDATTGGGVWLQIIDKKTGLAITEGRSSISGNDWVFDTKAVLPEGHYVVRSTILDQAANRVSSSDQLLIIDRTVSPIIPAFQVLEPVSGVTTVKEYYVGANEVGGYSFDSIVMRPYSGGYFDLGELKGKNFTNGVEIVFTDVAGNSVIVNNSAVTAPFASDAILTRAADANHPASLPSPGYSAQHPTTVGTVGAKLEIKGNTEFDMSVLYDGIAAIPDRAAVNHVDLLTDKSAQTLNISVQDILALGVGDSFLSTGTHAGKIQMRIDGDDKDKVNLVNADGAVGTAVWTVNQVTKVSLEGVVGEYFQATNMTSGLEVFIKTGVEINIV
jgi:hypothetical protein